MDERSAMEKINKLVNFFSQVALVAAAVNEFAVKFVDQVPVYAPIVVGIVAGATTPSGILALLLGGLKGKK